jgi:hypothetical protein
VEGRARAGDITPPDDARRTSPLHLFFKKQFLKTEEFEDLQAQNAPLAEAMMAHVDQIEQAIQAKQAAAAAAANPQPPAPADTRSPVDKGDRSALDAAVQGGVLSPVGPPAAPAKPDVMGAATAAGVLTPVGSGPAPDVMGSAVHAGILTPVGASASAPTGPSIDDLVSGGVLTPVPPEQTASPPA